MTTAADAPAVHPSDTTIPPLMRGICEQIDHDLSKLAWLLAGQPDALPEGSINQILKLSETINQLRNHIRD